MSAPASSRSPSRVPLPPMPPRFVVNALMGFVKAGLVVERVIPTAVPNAIVVMRTP